MANYRKLIKFTYLNQYLVLMIILNENILLDLHMNYMEVNIKLSLNF